MERVKFTMNYSFVADNLTYNLQNRFFCCYSLADKHVTISSAEELKLSANQRHSANCNQSVRARKSDVLCLVNKNIPPRAIGQFSSKRSSVASRYITKRFSASELHYFAGRAMILEIRQFKRPYLFTILYIKVMNIRDHTTVSSLDDRLCRPINIRLCGHRHSFQRDVTGKHFKCVSLMSTIFLRRFDLIPSRGLLLGASRSHSDTPHSVGLLWTSDQRDEETCT
jgi:hypothetical protein